MFTRTAFSESSAVRTSIFRAKLRDRCHPQGGSKLLHDEEETPSPHTCSSIRPGSSIISLIRFKKPTASRPSTIR